MSREFRQDREALLDQLTLETRANQRATDVVDSVVCELLGINRTDARCLDVLDERGRMSAGELAAASRLTSGAITAVVDRLERFGYVRRVADPADRRRVLIEPTPEVYEAGRELMHVMTEEARPMVERYSDDQLRLIIEFTRAGRGLQERHAEWLREKLREGWTPPGRPKGRPKDLPTAPARRRPVTRTAPG
jgi:DNA-binding MarR family transcriptional regulator